MLSGALATSLVDAGSEPGPDIPFAEMLRLVPAEAIEPGGAMIVEYVDMAALWRRAGVEGGAGERLAAFREVEWIPSFPQLPHLFGNYPLDQDALTEVGLAIQHVEQEIAVINPPSRLLVVATSAPAADIADAVHADPNWSAELGVVTTDVGDYFSWGDDGLRQVLTRLSAFRPIGQAGFLAVLGDDAATLIRTLEAEPMEHTLAAAAGVATPLANGWLFEPVLGAVGQREVLFATAVARPTVSDPLLGGTGAPAVDGSSEGFDGVLPYLGIVVVGFAEGDGSQTEILVVHASDELATANAARVNAWLDATSARAPLTFSELLDGAEVSADGVLVRIATGGDDSYRRAVSMIHTGELLPVGATDSA